MSTPLEAIVNGSDAAVVGEFAQEAVEPRPVPVGDVLVVGSANARVIDTDAYAPAPRRVNASRSLTDAASFVAYVTRHCTEFTEVYAHQMSSTVVAVIDSNAGPFSFGWEKHRLNLALEKTKAWIAWERADLTGATPYWFDQQEFAEFIEDRALDVIDPDHARLIEIATTFEAKKSADFGSAVRLADGNVRFQYEETTTAKAGQKGNLYIPQKIRLAIKPYVGGPVYSVWAAFRYRITSGALKLGFALERPENILEAAFADIVTEIRDGKTTTDADGNETVVHAGIGSVPLFYGRP